MKFLENGCCRWRKEGDNMLQEFISHALTVTLAKKAVNKVHNDFKVKQEGWVSISEPPVFVTVIGIVSMVFWLALMGLVLWQGNDTETIVFCGVVFGGAFLLGLFLTLYGINYKAVYKNNKIFYTNIFRKTRVYDCKDIKEVYYNDSGSTKFVFNDNKKLSFGKEEEDFSYAILSGEKLKYKFKGDENSIVKMYLHPSLSLPFWAFFAFSLWGMFDDPALVVVAVPLFFICLAASMAYKVCYTQYDKKQKILKRTRFGFSKTYDMRYHIAKPVYENGFLMYIEIYKYNKKVAKIPVSVEYKNRALFARLLCRVGVNQ